MIILLIFLFSVMNAADAAKILAVFPTASISHQVTLRTLTNALEDEGHELTIISTNPELGRKHTSTIEIGLQFTYDFFRESFDIEKSKQAKASEYTMMENWIQLLQRMNKEQFANRDVRLLIRSRRKVKFDLVIVEYLMYYPWFALADWFNAPLIGITTLDMGAQMHEAHGNVMHPIMHPEFTLPFLECSSLPQRFKALKYYVLNKFYYMPRIQSSVTEVIEKYMPGTETSIEKLGQKADLIMTNTNPVLGFIRPVLPTTIQLGFLHIKPPMCIADNVLRNFLDSSKVIYMSFGSNVHSSNLDASIIDIFLNVFKMLPYKVVWKWELECLYKQPDNVFIQKWLPQADLLAHPNVVLFITQGGQQSLEEAIDRGVPLLVIPFIGDQDANAQRVKKLKIGSHLDLNEMTEDSLCNAILNVIYTSGFKANIQKVRELAYDQPMKSLERAVWWVEYVIRHNGTKHLEYGAKDIPLYQLYLLDMIGVLFLSIGLMILLKRCLIG